MAKKIPYFIFSLLFCITILFVVLSPQKVQAAESSSTVVLKVKSNSDITNALETAMDPNTTIIIPD